MNTHKEQISTTQIVFMIILFEIGSSMLVSPGGDAGRDSWIAVLMGAILGLFGVLLFLWIQRIAPKLDLIEMFLHSFGKPIGIVFGLLYFFYFSYEAMRNVRDLGELTSLSILPLTPIYVTMLIFVLTASYLIWQGIEVISRFPEIVLPIGLFIFFIIIFLLIAFGSVNFHELTPILEDGFMPVINATIPSTLTLPFGQMIVFLMIWHKWNKPGAPVKGVLFSYSAVGLFLVFLNALMTSILGPELYSIIFLPLIKSVRTLSNLKFIERLDILVVLLLYFSLLMKMVLFYYCAVQTLVRLTAIQIKKWILPVSGFIYGTAFVERDLHEHLVWMKTSAYVFPIFQFGIPLILFMTMMMKQHFRSNRSI
ncbi:GerAB/ArcD/ProY family transporter [Paenibacillus sp. Marseille-Q4541]|uniref:GerAB/ArcD/ProY family transporter n=1 Tax=Paenibacillus sp. Marseille-Q4541 TaxID=2831522 RepID=UPI001BA8756A|nr:GerAB/ArcD/ProY family transporter [Paenibacillus sp. Marseille-Q4541]